MKNLKTIGIIVTLIGLIIGVPGIIMYHFNYPEYLKATYTGPWLFLSGLMVLMIRLLILAIKSLRTKNKNIGGLITYAILTFWVFCGIWGLALVTVGNSILKNSDAYETATNHIRESDEYKTKLGNIYRFGFMIGGSLSSIKADLNFSVRATEGNFDVHAVLHKEEQDEKWEIQSISIK